MYRPLASSSGLRTPRREKWNVGFAMSSEGVTGAKWVHNHGDLAERKQTGVGCRGRESLAPKQVVTEGVEASPKGIVRPARKLPELPHGRWPPAWVSRSKKLHVTPAAELLLRCQARATSSELAQKKGLVAEQSFAPSEGSNIKPSVEGEVEGTNPSFHYRSGKHGELWGRGRLGCSAFEGDDHRACVDDGRVAYLLSLLAISSTRAISSAVGGSRSCSVRRRWVSSSRPSKRRGSKKGSWRRPTRRQAMGEGLKGGERAGHSTYRLGVLIADEVVGPASRDESWEGQRAHRKGCRRAEGK